MYTTDNVYSRFGLGFYQNSQFELTKEMIRKSLHMLIALVPSLAALNFYFTVLVLGVGVLIYGYAESLRIAGYRVAVVSYLTVISSRRGDEAHFVLGPVTLGIGAMLALMLYPEPASAIAIYALAFGDGLSSLVGKWLGTIQIPWSQPKTIAGSTACFFVVFLISYTITGQVAYALIISVVAAFLESLPIGDMDNIVLPLGTGFVANLLLFSVI